MRLVFKSVNIFHYEKISASFFARDYDFSISTLFS